MAKKVPQLDMNYTYDVAEEVDDPRMNRRTILNYGEIGTGKTYALQTLPNSVKPILFVDFDGNWRQLKGTEGLVRFAPPRTQGDTPVGFEWTKEIVSQAWMGDFDHGGERFRTIVVDSLTTWYQACLDAAMHTAGKALEAQPSQPDYGVAKRAMEGVLSTWRLDTDFNLIVLAHEAREKDEGSAIIKGVPAITGQLSITLPRFFGEILHSYTKGGGEKTHWYWATRPKGVFAARTSVDGLPAEECPQDYGRLFA